MTLTSEQHEQLCERARAELEFMNSDKFKKMKAFIESKTGKPYVMRFD